MNIKFISVIALVSLGVSLATGAFGRTLDACDATEIKTTGWKRVPVKSSPIFLSYSKSPVIFLLPPEFKPDPSGKSRHGGILWKSGKIKFSEVYGHWGPTSFKPASMDPDTYSECKTTVDGHPALLMTSVFQEQYSATLWITDLAGPSPILSGYGTSPEDQRLLLAIMRTAKVKK
jgi:hypothetical protein